MQHNPCDDGIMTSNAGEGKLVGETRQKKSSNQSQGEPRHNNVMEPETGSNSSSSPSRPKSSASPSDQKPIKSILKNRDMKSPLAPNAMTYSGPAEPEAGLIIRDNNYEDEHRFSKLVDSKEIYAKKVKAGHIKNRRRNSSIESTPELSFHPKRQDDNDDTDHEPPPRSYKPPVTV